MPQRHAVVHSGPAILGGTPVFVCSRLPVKALLGCVWLNFWLEAHGIGKRKMRVKRLLDCDYDLKAPDPAIAKKTLVA